MTRPVTALSDTELDQALRALAGRLSDVEGAEEAAAVVEESAAIAQEMRARALIDDVGLAQVEWVNAQLMGVRPS